MGVFQRRWRRDATIGIAGKFGEKPFEMADQSLDGAAVEQVRGVFHGAGEAVRRLVHEQREVEL
jgi:hypothetical protein